MLCGYDGGARYSSSEWQEETLATEVVPRLSNRPLRFFAEAFFFF